MQDPLDTLRSELDERLAELRPLVSEYERLRAAAAALDAIDAGAEAAQPEQPATVRRGAQSQGNGAPKRKRTRSPRGENRAKLLAALNERPGVSVNELAAASGIQRSGVYALLRRLTEEGMADKRDLPGGGAGYALRSAT